MTAEHKTNELFNIHTRGESLDVLQQNYDGTNLDGTVGFVVVLDNNGEFDFICPYSTFTNKLYPQSYAKNNSGNWLVGSHIYKDTSRLGKRLNEIVENTMSQWKLWKDTQGDLSIDFRTWRLDRLRKSGD